jgi:hypothetical protein
VHSVPGECLGEELFAVDETGVELGVAELLDELGEVRHDLIHGRSLRRIVLHHALDKRLQKVGIPIFLTMVSTIARCRYERAHLKEVLADEIAHVVYVGEKRIVPTLLVLVLGRTLVCALDNLL